MGHVYLLYRSLCPGTQRGPGRLLVSSDPRRDEEERAGPRADVPGRVRTAIHLGLPERRAPNAKSERRRSVGRSAPHGIRRRVRDQAKGSAKAALRFFSFLQKPSAGTPHGEVLAFPEARGDERRVGRETRLDMRRTAPI